MPIDILAQIGFVVLLGLAAKNAILIVEFAKQWQDREGVDAQEAAVHSARVRLRPILMTSLAFIAGVSSACCCPWRRLRDEAVSWNHGVLRNARCDRLRPSIYARILCPRS